MEKKTEKKAENKKITVCIGAFPEAMYLQCNEKVKKLKEAGFNEAKVAAGKYLCVCAGEYETKEKAADAMAKLKEMGFNPYELAD